MVTNNPSLKSRPSEGIQSFEEIVKMVEATPFHRLMPEKFMLGQKHWIQIKFGSMKREGTPISPREAVALVINGLPDTLPPDIVLELVQYSLKMWGTYFKEETPIN